MMPVSVITGVAAPLPIANIDTDVIIRIEHLTQTARESLGAFALGSLRFRADGTEDPDFILNQRPWRGAPVLVAGRNFGCGSSREHAVWALQGLGIGCVIAPSFGDIFRANCFQNGLLPVQLDAEVHERLLTTLEAGRLAGQAVTLGVDLVRQVVSVPGSADLPFVIDAGRRQALLEGLDEIGQTLTHAALIAAWQAKDRDERPWIWPSTGVGQQTPGTTSR